MANKIINTLLITGLILMVLAVFAVDRYAKGRWPFEVERPACPETLNDPDLFGDCSRPAMLEPEWPEYRDRVE